MGEGGVTLSDASVSGSTDVLLVAFSIALLKYENHHPRQGVAPVLVLEL